jgi:hypothetical protein
VGALPLFKDQFQSIGYQEDAVVEDYVFSDVMEAHPVDRTVALAAFTQTPPSYRNAALAVVFTDGRDELRIIDEYRALGAPLLFLVEADQVSTWQVRPGGSHRLIARLNQNNLTGTFSDNRDAWSPLSIQRAKSIGHVDKGYQRDFVDAGLLPAIEGQIHAKLDRLLKEALATLTEGRDSGGGVEDRAIFRTTFRLLAAKVLQDRGHPVASKWSGGSLDDVLNSITTYYNLPEMDAERTERHRTQFASVWDRLTRGISFRNISSDDLAYIYENTLITPETRKHFGTHSTPRAVAEYVVRGLELWRRDVSVTRIYEPFAGAGVFLVAALRQMRDMLPMEWSETEKHDYLVKRLSGDELDAFASEVAKLSLILADYPNANGWQIGTCDLFDTDRLSSRLAGEDVVLCNPPFESFTSAERVSYPEAASRSPLKPASVLRAALAAAPAAVGFVMPRPFLQGDAYASVREEIEKLYTDIELVSLPDRIFKASPVRSSLLIAKGLRRHNESCITRVKSTTVLDKDRERFLEAGQVSFSRTSEKNMFDRTGQLWEQELREVWKYLRKAPTLGQVALVHRGLEWFEGHGRSVSEVPKEGSLPGVHAANAIAPFGIRRTAFLEVRRGKVKAAGNHPWSQPKIIANAARISRGPWCFAAAVDYSGLVASQQLFGIWPKDGDFSLGTLAAVLNSAVSNAYVATHSPPDRIRVSTLRDLPLPSGDLAGLDGLVRRYEEAVREDIGLLTASRDHEAAALLSQIDSLVLSAYRLPSDLEQILQLYVAAGERTLLHENLSDGGAAKNPHREEILAAASLRHQLTEAAGGLLTSREARELLGLSADALLRRLAKGELLTVTEDAKILFPACQFQGGRVVEGIREVVQNGDVSGWRMLQFLMGKPDGLGGARPIDLLRNGRPEDRSRAIVFSRVLND